MRKEFYKTLLNPATKNVAIKSIKNELTYVTSPSNIINILTDNKMRNSTQYIRTTVFVQDKDEIRYKNLYRVEARLKKLFGIKFKLIFCNANLSPNEILRLSSLKGKNTISFIDIENFTLREQSEKEKIQNIRNLVFETLIMGNNDSMVICANGEVLDLSERELSEYVENDQVVLIRTGGKDCSDLRLVQTIQKLFEQGKLNNYSKINIVSGDGFFSSIVNWLKNKKFNLNIYGQLEVSHHELANDLNFIPLSKSNLVLPKI